MTAPELPTEPAPPAERPVPPAVQFLVRVVGGAVATVGGVLVGILGLILVPLRVATPVGLVRLPVAVVFVVVAVAALLWFAAYTTQTRWGTLLPAAGWLLIAVAASTGSTTDGSLLLIGDDWVGVLMIFSGTAVAAIGVVSALMRRPPPR